ncbi:MAG: hypothetical protein HY978_01285 [Candidatus Liptonbacteria bacterium]|nr:hypothetical protein [Candidatus Liptonbacteria bacterium]
MFLFWVVLILLVVILSLVLKIAQLSRAVHRLRRMLFQLEVGSRGGRWDDTDDDSETGDAQGH